MQTYSVTSEYPLIKYFPYGLHSFRYYVGCIAGHTHRNPEQIQAQ